MKSRMQLIDDPAEQRRISVFRSSAVAVLALLFGGVILLHPGARSVHEVEQHATPPSAEGPSVPLPPLPPIDSTPENQPPTF
ncbi:MAG: hypothetical protein H0W18_17660 [Acidobacteria bacterium]|nr:hypothetical protein [Acidobacteriota bacterium]